MIVKRAGAQGPITILIAALGGEGGGILCEWLVDLARQAGLAAQATSIPGVAQRTGATSYYVEIDPRPGSADTPNMVMSLSPVPGCIDLFIASELLEAVRAIQNGFISADRTHVISSGHRTLTVAEKSLPGDGRFDSDKLVAVAKANSASLAIFDIEAAARDAGTVPSAVMFGAIAASGLLPLPRSAFEAVINTSGRGVAESLRGLDLAMSRMAGQAEMPRPAASKNDDLLSIARARVIAFQNEHYGALFDRRIARIAELESRVDPASQHGGKLVQEFARFLGLWMAFDDVIKVASFKLAPQRFARIRNEVGAKADDIVTVKDHLKPGVPELAGLLPRGFAQPLLAWDERRQQQGRRPLALALKLRADTVVGQLLLRCLAALKVLRPIGQRYAEEQELIERWIATIAEAGGRDWNIAMELVLCGRLIKGYGETNRRAKARLKSILGASANLGAADIKAIREAALKLDE